MKFPPPGWNSQGKGGEGEEREGDRKWVGWGGRKGEGGERVRGEGGEVSVAWPGQGQNWGEKGEEFPPVCIHTGLVSGMVLAQPQPPPCPPAHPSIRLRCLGMLVRGYQGGGTPGAGPQELRSEQYLGVRI